MNSCVYSGSSNIYVYIYMYIRLYIYIFTRESTHIYINTYMKICVYSGSCYPKLWWRRPRHGHITRHRAEWHIVTAVDFEAHHPRCRRNHWQVCVVQCVAVRCTVLQWISKRTIRIVHERTGKYVCCSVLQCVAVCCSALQCVAVCCSVLQHPCCRRNHWQVCVIWYVVVHCRFADSWSVLQWISKRTTICIVDKITGRYVCCSVLQCVAVCCRVLHCVALCCNALQCVAVDFKAHHHLRCRRNHWQVCVLQSVAECCSVLQCVAVCCSVLQCVAVDFEAHHPHCRQNHG